MGLLLKVDFSPDVSEVVCDKVFVGEFVVAVVVTVVVVHVAVVGVFVTVVNVVVVVVAVVVDVVDVVDFVDEDELEEWIASPFTVVCDVVKLSSATIDIHKLRIYWWR